MSVTNSPSVGAQAAAVLAGAVLSGTMMSNSFIATPVILEVNSDPAHLLRQWARLYQYGVRIMPAGSITTTLLYAYSITNMMRESQPWFYYAMAAAATLGMIPYTLLVMLPTNNRLFKLNEQSGGKTLPETHQLIQKWRKLATGRALFPLLGAVLGLVGLCSSK